jgi:hypothetical protein
MQPLIGIGIYRRLYGSPSARPAYYRRTLPMGGAHFPLVGAGFGDPPVRSLILLALPPLALALAGVLYWLSDVPAMSLGRQLEIRIDANLE